MRMLFEQWGYSILQTDVSSWFQPKDNSYLKKALSVNRIGIHFFRFKHQFYFDCFYLIESFDKSLLGRLNDFLRECGSNVFTKGSLNLTNGYFNDGIGDLKVEDVLIKHRQKNIEFAQQYENRILIVATVSAGKSTLINALTGHSFNKVKNGVCTTRISRIHNKPFSDGIILKNKTKYSYDSDIDSHTSHDSDEVGFHFESTLGSHKICLVDTPGVNNARDTSHFNITTEAIKSQDYDFMIFISNGQYNGTNDERQLLNLIYKNSKKPILFVLNQLDRFKSAEDDIEKMMNEYKKELLSIGFKSPKVIPLSAQFAYLLRMKNTLDEEEIDELNILRKRFSKEFLDLPKYVGKTSNMELSRSGITLLERNIENNLK